MTEPATVPELDADLVRTLRALSDAAIEARPYVSAVRRRADGRGDAALVATLDRVLDGLDCAIADAGEVLGWPA